MCRALAAAPRASAGSIPAASQLAAGPAIMLSERAGELRAGLFVGSSRGRPASMTQSERVWRLLPRRRRASFGWRAACVAVRRRPANQCGAKLTARSAPSLIKPGRVCSTLDLAALVGVLELESAHCAMGLELIGRALAGVQQVEAHAQVCACPSRRAGAESASQWAGCCPSKGPTKVIRLMCFGGSARNGQQVGAERPASWPGRPTRAAVAWLRI